MQNLLNSFLLQRLKNAFFVLAFGVIVFSNQPASAQNSESAPRYYKIVSDTLSVQMFGRQWSAKSFYTDTIADELMSDLGHGYMYQLAGASDGDTLFLRFPTITAMVKKTGAPLVAEMPSTNKNTAYVYLSLDTGWFDVDYSTFIDYTPAFDAELHIGNHRESASNKSYYSCLANYFKPKGRFHLLHIDAHSLYGTFYCDVANSSKDPSEQLANGYFHMTFTESEREISENLKQPTN
jgi:hypothetical protein